MDSFRKSKWPYCESCYLKAKAWKNLGRQTHWNILREILEQQNNICPFSGDEIILGVNDSLDHIKPIGHFPELKNEITNVQWVTREINRMKRDRTPEQFISLIQKIAKHTRS